MYSTGNLRRVKKFELRLKQNKGDYKMDVFSCSRGQTTPLPVFSTGYHRGLDRTLGLLTKGLKDNDLLSDKEILDCLLDSHTVHRAKAVALIATWEPKKKKK